MRKGLVREWIFIGESRPSRWERGDPYGMLGIGNFEKPMFFENELEAAKKLIPLIPRILGKKKIPENILKGKDVIINDSYFDALRVYHHKYFKINHKHHPGVWSICLYFLLRGLGFDGEDHWVESRYNKIKDLPEEERFLMESGFVRGDPYQILGIGSFKIPKVFNTELEAAKELFRLLPRILETEGIPEDSLGEGSVIIKNEYFEKINDYYSKYFTVKEERDLNDPLMDHSWTSMLYYLLRDYGIEPPPNKNIIMEKYYNKYKELRKLGKI